MSESGFPSCGYIWIIPFSFSSQSDILFVLSVFYMFVLDAYNFPIQIVFLFQFLYDRIYFNCIFPYSCVIVHNCL